MHRVVRRGVPLVASLVVLAALAAPVAASARLQSGERPDLPPPTKEAIAALFDAKLAKLGLRTTRALLQNLTTYRSDPNGTHLAIYVEPTAATSNARYLTMLVKSARVFLPKVFKEWSGLKSFDICLEPPPGVDDRAEPAPETQLLVSRKGAGYVRWKHATLARLLQESTEPRATAAEQRDFFVYVDQELMKDPAYQAAIATVSTTSTSSVNR